jgi:branched-chain amino acid transport system permease protein
MKIVGGLSFVALVGLPFVANPATLRVGGLFFLTLTALTGLHIVSGLTKVVSLCHAAFIGVGAYGAAIATLRYGLPPAVGLLLGLLAAGCCALILAWLTTRLDEHYLALGTLAAGEILLNIFRGATSVTGGANGLSGVPPLQLFGLLLDTPARYYPFCLTIGLAALAFVWRFDRGGMGRSLRAMGDEGVLVEALGVSGSLLRAVGFTIGGSLAGLAGAASAYVDGFVGPESYGVGLSIAFLCFLVIGGLGRLGGVVLAAALATLGPEVFRGLLEWQMVVVAALSLGLLVLRTARARGSLASGFALPLARPDGSRV